VIGLSHGLHAEEAPDRVKAIRAGVVIDVLNGKTEKDQTITIAGGRIKVVGKNLRIPRDAEVIDLSNLTVLPGLIDSHTHLTTQPGENYYKSNCNGITHRPGSAGPYLCQAHS
jgi:imidazolonepropionase-like amidohydrolase